jgi:hypothetical protein
MCICYILNPFVSPSVVSLTGDNKRIYIQKRSMRIIIRTIGEGEARRRKCKPLRLGGGQAYDR